MSKNKCEHDKVYEQCLLLSNPPQNRWICRKCGQTGVDAVGFIGTGEYEKIFKKFDKTLDK